MGIEQQLEVHFPGVILSEARLALGGGQGERMGQISCQISHRRLFDFCFLSTTVPQQ